MEMRYIVRLSDSTNKILTTFTVLNTKLQADIIKIALIANISSLHLQNYFCQQLFHSEIARTAVRSITARDTTVDPAPPPYGSAGGVVTPLGSTSVKFSPTRKLLTGVPRERAWLMSISWSS